MRRLRRSPANSPTEVGPTLPTTGADGAELYLELLKRALTHMLYFPIDSISGDEYASEEMKAAFVAWVEAGNTWDTTEVRASGGDWPRYAQTMVGRARLDNVHECVDRVLAEGVPGDFIEAGVWRGGVTILMRGVLQARGIGERRVYVADSFRGLPPPNADRYPADAGDPHHVSDLLSVSRRTVERNFDLYGLLDDQVVFVEGWFKDTLPALAGNTWSLIRLDGDLYESTMDTLEHLYPALSPGGFVIVDDFAYQPCRQAVEDYRSAHRITDPIEEIDWTGVYWRRSEPQN